MSAPVAEPLAPAFLAEAALDTAEARARGCANPVRLRGSTMFVDTSTGEATTVYTSDRELDGFTYARCGNRRASVCESCSHEYKGDAWHLLVCGLAGGRGIPDSVADRPCTCVTLTAPSFGPVHGARDKGPCRARRDKPACPHGRPLWCNKRHHAADSQLGEPLCPDCYDYVGHVLWQWYAPKLWRRFTIALQRQLAKLCSLPVSRFREGCRVSYSKVVGLDGAGAEPELRESTARWLHEVVAGMNLENVLVRAHRQQVETWASWDRWATVSKDDANEILEHLAGLPSTVRDPDEDARRFDLLVLRRQLAQLEGDAVAAERIRETVQAIAAALLPKKNIPSVAEQLALLDEVAGDEWWATLRCPCSKS